MSQAPRLQSSHSPVSRRHSNRSRRSPCRVIAEQHLAQRVDGRRARSSTVVSGADRSVVQRHGSAVPVLPPASIARASNTCAPFADRRPTPGTRPRRRRRAGTRGARPQSSTSTVNAGRTSPLRGLGPSAIVTRGAASIVQSHTAGVASARLYACARASNRWLPSRQLLEAHRRRGTPPTRRRRAGTGTRPRPPRDSANAARARATDGRRPLSIRVSTVRRTHHPREDRRRRIARCPRSSTRVWPAARASRPRAPRSARSRLVLGHSVSSAPAVEHASHPDRVVEPRVALVCPELRGARPRSARTAGS